MKFTQTTPAALPVTYAQAAAHLRLVNDADSAYVNDLIAAATEYAEEALAASLITRTITATFYAGELLRLPRGPLIAVTSVQPQGSTPITNYTLEKYGHSDELVIPQNAFAPPIMVVYTAGYGPNPTDVPADIRMAIRMHTYTLYENRQTITTGERAGVPIPHTLSDFYRLKSRSTGVR
jgi:uncharacterized phiE125 gp8 family phage protein